MNTEMKIFETEIKDIQELQAKARKYDELVKAVNIISEELKNGNIGSYNYDSALNWARRLIRQHTEGLI